MSLDTKFQLKLTNLIFGPNFPKNYISDRTTMEKVNTTIELATRLRISLGTKFGGVHFSHFRSFFEWWCSLFPFSVRNILFGPKNQNCQFKPKFGT